MKPMMSKKGLKPLPAFNSEGEERDFWGHEDSTEYIDWTKAKRVAFPNLKPSVRTISVRLPVTRKRKPIGKGPKLVANIATEGER